MGHLSPALSPTSWRRGGKRRWGGVRLWSVWTARRFGNLRYGGVGGRGSARRVRGLLGTWRLLRLALRAQPRSGGKLFGGEEALLFGNLEDLGEGLFDLAGGLGIDAVAAAGFDAEVVVPGILVGAHQGEEIGVLACLEEFAGLGDVFILAAEALEEVAAADEGGAKGGGTDAIAAGGLDQHTGIARVHGQALHLAADGSEFVGGSIEGAEDAEELLGAFDGGRVGFIEPVEFGGLANVERVEEENDLGEIAALDFGCVALGAVEVAALGPKAVASARGGAAGAAFALIGGGAADLFDQERADAAFGVVSGDAGLAAVHNVTDAVDGDGGFGDIGGDDDFSIRIGGKGEVLVLGLELAVERDEGDAFADVGGSNGGDGGIDLAHAGHEDEDIALGAGVDDSGDDISGLVRDWAFVMAAEVADFDRETLALGDQDGAGGGVRGREVISNGLGVQCGGHDSELEVGAAGLLEIFDEGQGDVAEEIALVEFVKEDDADVGERAVVLEPAEEDALGDKADARAEGGLVVETDLIADFCAEFDLAFPGDAGGDGAGGNTAGLKNDNLARAGEIGVEQHLGNLRGLAGAGGGDEDEAVAGAQGGHDGIVDLPDGKGFLHGGKRLSVVSSGRRRGGTKIQRSTNIQTSRCKVGAGRGVYAVADCGTWHGLRNAGVMSRRITQKWT